MRRWGQIAALAGSLAFGGIASTAAPGQVFSQMKVAPPLSPLSNESSQEIHPLRPGMLFSVSRFSWPKLPDLRGNGVIDVRGTLTIGSSPYRSHRNGDLIFGDTDETIIIVSHNSSEVRISEQLLNRVLWHRSYARPCENAVDLPHDRGPPLHLGLVALAVIEPNTYMCIPALTGDGTLDIRGAIAIGDPPYVVYRRNTGIYGDGLHAVTIIVHASGCLELSHNVVQRIRWLSHGGLHARTSAAPLRRPSGSETLCLENGVCTFRSQCTPSNRLLLELHGSLLLGTAPYAVYHAGTTLATAAQSGLTIHIAHDSAARISEAFSEPLSFSTTSPEAP